MIGKLCRWLYRLCWRERAQIYSRGWTSGCKACHEAGEVIPPPPWNGRGQVPVFRGRPNNTIGGKRLPPARAAILAWQHIRQNKEA